MAVPSKEKEVPMTCGQPTSAAFVLSQVILENGRLQSLPENDLNGKYQEGNVISTPVPIIEEPATEHLLDANTSSAGCNKHPVHFLHL